MENINKALILFMAAILGSSVFAQGASWKKRPDEQTQHGSDLKEALLSAVAAQLQPQPEPQPQQQQPAAPAQGLSIGGGVSGNTNGNSNSYTYGTGTGATDSNTQGWTWLNDPAKTAPYYNSYHLRPYFTAGYNARWTDSSEDNIDRDSGTFAAGYQGIRSNNSLSPMSFWIPSELRLDIRTNTTPITIEDLKVALQRFIWNPTENNMLVLDLGKALYKDFNYNIGRKTGLDLASVDFYPNFDIKNLGFCGGEKVKCELNIIMHAGTHLGYSRLQQGEADGFNPLKNASHSLSTGLRFDLGVGLNRTILVNIFYVMDHNSRIGSSETVNGDNNADSYKTITTHKYGVEGVYTLTQKDCPNPKTLMENNENSQRTTQCYGTPQWMLNLRYEHFRADINNDNVNPALANDNKSNDQIRLLTTFMF